MVLAKTLGIFKTWLLWA